MNNNSYLKNLRHSCAHLLAAAVMQLYPDAKRAIGPAIDTGFYFDFDFGKIKISEGDFAKIEKKMHEIAKTWNKFTKYELTAAEAKKEFKNNPYKTELIDEFAKTNEKVTFYKSGDYWDLCRGGHCDNPSVELANFKLLSIAGAYWRGNEKNPMLTRIYATIFPTQKELEQYLAMQEEAKRRDHRKIGQELDLFTFSDLVGKGLPLFTPKGTILRDLLNEFSQGLRLEQGFVKVWVPHIAKIDLYKKSGHWDKFGDELFLVTSQETKDKMVLKPMNCPHHGQIYASRPRSYRELPIKYLETTTIYRDEKAGELNGLSRVRSATQDDSHSFCTPDQIEQVYSSLIKIIQKFYDTLGMKYRARLSFSDPTTPEKYLGDKSLWKKAEEILLKIAKENNLDYFEVKGEAAFYGPKIDFMVTDALGREWQLATPQLDFVQPQRFGLKYVDSDGSEKNPVMIHFALLGSIERFLSVYIEHTGGKFPLWLAPVQVIVLPISDKVADYSKNVFEKIKEAGIRVELNSTNSPIGAKIREATLQKIPFQCIIGEKEMVQSEAGSDLFISIRSRDGENLGTQDLNSFISTLKNDIEKRK